MKESLIFEGNSVEEAVEEAVRKLNIPKENLKYEVVEEGSKGFLGVFSKKAKIKVEIDLHVDEVKEKINEIVENELKIDVDEEFGDVLNRVSEEKESVEEPEKLNEEENIDEVVEKVKEFIREIFGFFEISVNIEVRKRKNQNMVNLNIFTMGSQIPTKNLEDFILSLQFLINKYSSLKLKSKINFILDINEFMAKKIERLKNLAIEISKKVRREGKSYTLKPMIASDRRVIHLALKNNKFVKTESRGDGEKKRVIISPVRRNNRKNA